MSDKQWEKLALARADRVGVLEAEVEQLRGALAQIRDFPDRSGRMDAIRTIIFKALRDGHDVKGER